MKKRLLIVEDNARLLRVIHVYLEKEGFEVMTARDGADALVRLAETIPDLIVSDIMMPGMDGFAFADNVRSNPRTDLIPIIFLTAKTRREDRIEGFRAGVDAYLVKPFEPDELVAVIENILQRVARTHRRVARAANPAEATNKSPRLITGTIPSVGKIEKAEKAEKSEKAEKGGNKMPGSDLTAAEERVARLVAKTMSNKEIAAHLKISVRTVEMHVSRILAKKDFSNRVEIARYIIQRDLAQ